MSEEELYQLAMSNIHRYSLLNEILGIRDNRYPNEQVDYCISVNGYISLNSLNRYVSYISELEKLQNNWNELKKWLESKGTSTKEENDALCYFYTYKKMQELEQGKDE